MQVVLVVGTLVIVAAAALGLLRLGAWAGRVPGGLDPTGRELGLRGSAGAEPRAGGHVVWTQLRYQPASALVALAALAGIWGLRALLGQPVAPWQYLQVGDLFAPVVGISLLADPGTSWARLGLTFAIVATALTAVVVSLQHRPPARPGRLLRALPVAVAFAVVNAGVEEVIFRVAVGQGLFGAMAPAVIAVSSGLLFGVPHWFGNPGRLPGSLMAGFLGWLMATSMLATGGIAWAWGIHALQDVVILAILLAGEPRDPGPGERSLSRLHQSQ